MVNIYFFFVRIAAFLGNKKARQLVKGQSQTLTLLESDNQSAESESGRRTVWFHAASVGEFEQVRPIIERLRKEGSNLRLILTFFSPSGYEMRKNYDKVDKVYYLPFATRSNARRFLDLVHPDMAVFAKYEFWPAYLKELRERGIPTYSVSAIFRPGQLFFRPWGKSYLNLLRCFTHIYVQDTVSFDLLTKHGIRSVSVAGDTRFDRVSEIARQSKEISEAASFVRGKVMLGPEGEITDQRPVIVAGSTWPPDEALLAQYVKEREDVRLILVPHEINNEHLKHIFQLFEGRYVRFTQATPQNITTCRVLVVDTMGLLSSIYRYGTVAYIGGGFGVGIHNTLEAAVWGMPVLFGTNYHKFREAKGLIAAGAAVSVSNYKELAAAMDQAIEDHEQMGKRATDYVQSECGATEKIYRELFTK